MKFRNIITILTLIVFSGCESYQPKAKLEKRYSNTGFTLIYDENLYKNKLDNDSLQIFHSNLKKNSFVKITNPINNKTVIAKVKSNKTKFSNFYNSIISNKIFKTLELDIREPYIEIILISKESTFIAKKAKTFEEEKMVAEKVPINGIKISNLSTNKEINKKVSSKKKFSYSIKVADFYYKKTAQLMINRIKTKTSLDNLKIIQLSKTNYRVLIGPFNDIDSLKDSFEKMDSLYFENLEILKNA